MLQMSRAGLDKALQDLVDIVSTEVGASFEGADSAPNAKISE